ncbi:stage V sporulation protein AE [Desulforamulus ferrireducens]|uniref:Stage V sporulation protein AE n=1 Tax=Desulforamulus ferrireducens TaxID=1833852 RepID=A0A1S6IUT9_9FIRM|nr:stage V sporulation protein AE [Desulforamulus ferrireducens]AQS58548.1 stage V sporulation protein AE [Desulforamulus ferrireducens]
MILKAFLVGGTICLIGQLLMDLTSHKITPGHILVGFVTAGVVISALGLYQPLVDFAGAGATVPLTGFGHLLAQGAIAEAERGGLLGVFKGALTATAGGITAAVVFGYIAALVFKPKG